MTFYLLWCIECHPPDQPIPFDSSNARWEWAVQHVAGTGHTRLILLEQPSPWKIEATEPWNATGVSS